MAELDTRGDIIDAREVTDRIEELEAELPQKAGDVMPGTSDDIEDMQAELAMLEAFMESAKGCGGDHDWRGDWYPLIFIRDDYFETYMDEMLEDIGDLPRDLPGYLTITVNYDALQSDYTAFDLDGCAYWAR